MVDLAGNALQRASKAMGLWGKGCLLPGNLHLGQKGPLVWICVVFSTVVPRLGVPLVLRWQRMPHALMNCSPGVSRMPPGVQVPFAVTVAHGGVPCSMLCSGSVLRSPV